MENVKVIEEVPDDVFDKSYCFQVRYVMVHSRKTLMHVRCFQTHNVYTTILHDKCITNYIHLCGI